MTLGWPAGGPDLVASGEKPCWCRAMQKNANALDAAHWIWAKFDEHNAAHFGGNQRATCADPGLYCWWFPMHRPSWHEAPRGLG